MSGFGQREIAASVFAHWAANYPLEVTTVYPATRVDVAALNEWLEIWVNSWQRGPQRTGGKEQIDVSVTVHCFVERTLDKGRVLELADGVTATLQHQQIVISDQTLSGVPTVGHLQMFETQTRTLTRPDADAGRHRMQHVVLTTGGMATQF